MNSKHSYAVGLMALVMLAVFAAPGKAADFSAWSKKGVITFTGYGKAETLTSFPVLVKISNGNPAGFNYADFSSVNGNDLRFADAGGTELNYEIDNWNPTGESTVWVRVPTLSGTDTAITMYYGNAAATSQQAYTTNGAVWDANYRGLWHLNEATGVIRDSTVNANHGAPSNNVVAGGMIGAGQQFNGSAEITIPDADSLDVAYVTEEVWFKTTTLNSDGIYPRLIDKTYDKGYIICFVGAAPYGRVGTWMKGNTVQGTVNKMDGVWHQAVATYDGSFQRLYIDGAEVGTPFAWSGTIPANTSPFRIGTSSSVIEHFTGAIDEVRVSAAARSPDWIWAEYMNVASNSTFNTYSSMESTFSAVPRIVNVAPTGVTANAAWLCGNLSSTGTSETTVWVYWGTADAGTNGGSTFWQHAINFGTAGDAPNALSHQATGLNPRTTNYFNFYAVNASGGVWAAIAGLPYVTLGSTAGIDGSAKFAWSENAGWQNWNSSDGGATLTWGVSRSGDLSGYVWGENIGWIRLGNGNDGPYSNTGANDWGVNVSSAGALSGFAWSETCGWIKFNPTYGQVTIGSDGRFDGYAWSESIGWIHFNNASPAYNVKTTRRIPGGTVLLIR